MSLLTTAQVAERLAMSQEWVRDHAGELGAIRAGRSGRAPLRFEPEAIEAWMSRRRLGPLEERLSGRPPARRRRPSDVELLPIPPR